MTGLQTYLSGFHIFGVGSGSGGSLLSERQPILRLINSVIISTAPLPFIPSVYSSRGEGSPVAF